MSSSSRRTKLALLAAVMLTAGCIAEANPAGDTGEPAISTVPIVLDSAQLHLPVEEFLPTPAQSDRLAGARLILIQKCMARFGIVYAVAPIPSSAYGPVNLTDRRYGITAATQAATYGYGLGTRDPSLAPRPEKPDIGVEGHTVLFGQGKTIVNGLQVPHGGCIGEADRLLDQASPSSAEARLGNQLQLQSFEQSKADSRVKAVLAAWSACMGHAGLPYADPLSAAADPQFTGQPSPHQVTVATTDIACKAKTNLVGVWFTVESAYQHRAINAAKTRFAAAKTAIEARDKLAHTVIATAP